MPSRPPLEPFRGSTPAATLVFTTVLTQGPLSRVEVGRRTGLSSAAITKAVRPLLDAGYLLEAADGAKGAGLGRPANPLQVDAGEAAFALGAGGQSTSKHPGGARPRPGGRPGPAFLNDAGGIGYPVWTGRWEGVVRRVPVACLFRNADAAG